MCRPSLVFKLAQVLYKYSIPFFQNSPASTLKEVIFADRKILHLARIYFREVVYRNIFGELIFAKNYFKKGMLSVIILAFDGFLNKKGHIINTN